MKKFLAILVVMALVAPAMADVTITTDNANPGEVVITLDAGSDGIVGIGLEVDVTGGGTCTDASFAVDSFFDIFIDSAYDLGVGYDYPGTGPANGIPTAEQGAPGEMPLPASIFSISAGGLDDDGIGGGTEEAPTTAVITLTGTPDAPVEIDADTLRGGIVGYNGVLAIATTLPINTTFGAGSTDCVKSDAPFYADWLGSETNAAWQWNKPDCWCYEFNCRGDSDGIKGLGGLFRIDSVDLGALADAFNVGDKKLTQTLICADFDHIKGTGGLFRVDSDDLGILATWFNIGDKKLPACSLDWEDLDGPDGPGVGDGDDDYNGWIVP